VLRARTRLVLPALSFLCAASVGPRCGRVCACVRVHCVRACVCT
jgi:hypothetical protein